MKKRLGDILLERGMMDALQLHSALAYQRKWGVPLGQVVVDQRFCTAQQVLEALAEQVGMQTVDLDAQPPEAALARLIPERVAETHRVVPLRLEGHAPRDTLVVAIAAPASLASVDAVKSVTGRTRVVAKLATDASIRRAIGRMYRGETEVAPRRPGMEGFSLPEADEQMPMVLSGSMAELTNMAPPVVAAEGELPLLSSLEEETARPVIAAVPRPRTPSQTKLPTVTAAPAQALAQVLVYGWGAQAASGLVRVLTDAGFTARVASTEELLASSQTQVVVAPLPSLEALGRRVGAQVVAAGKTPEVDLPRAQAVGARGFVAAPVDAELLLRTVRRLAHAPVDTTFLRRAS
ncbi:general secretion pathway protein GspE [Myxococcus sp. K38C18041901]|uniref:GspE/PulE/PilB domain-containing protein n=1 Tax=Myxococcus guangdongensis TaxID=2906760 RepID=UPI0020A7C3CF|nr:general secretion pathway protein GspE [Myxococcus guangdongensis]MCP3063440.1 general secretion pathway protein GspE [Myxococcus guangdongensis]